MLHLQLIILSVGDDIYVDSETLLMIDFMDLKIKPTQSFRIGHRDRACVRVFIGMSAMYKYMCLYCVSKKMRLIIIDIVISILISR
jgi:hypothetical protein